MNKEAERVVRVLSYKVILPLVVSVLVSFLVPVAKQPHFFLAVIVFIIIALIDEVFRQKFRLGH